MYLVFITINFSVFGTSPPSLQEMDDGEDDNEEILMEPIDIQAAIQPTATSTVKLPIHHRCAAHTLNLIARDAEEKQEYVELHKSVAAKLKKLWNKQSRSSLISGDLVFFIILIFFLMIS